MDFLTICFYPSGSSMRGILFYNFVSCEPLLCMNCYHQTFKDYFQVYIAIKLWIPVGEYISKFRALFLNELNFATALACLDFITLLGETSIHNKAERFRKRKAGTISVVTIGMFNFQLFNFQFYLSVHSFMSVLARHNQKGYCLLWSFRICNLSNQKQFWSGR